MPPDSSSSTRPPVPTGSPPGPFTVRTDSIAWFGRMWTPRVTAGSFILPGTWCFRNTCAPSRTDRSIDVSGYSLSARDAAMRNDDAPATCSSAICITSDSMTPISRGTSRQGE